VDVEFSGVVFETGMVLVDPVDHGLERRAVLPDARSPDVEGHAVGTVEGRREKHRGLSGSDIGDQQRLGSPHALHEQGIPFRDADPEEHFGEPVDSQAIPRLREPGDREDEGMERAEQVHEILLYTLYLKKNT
jgi:hypothetical protein